MTKKGLKLLPVHVTTDRAVEIFKKLTTVSRLLSELNERFKHSIVSEELVQILLLNESVESTKIEGTEITFTDMIEEQHQNNPRKEITEVKNYQRALKTGYEQISFGYPLSTRLIKDLHRILMDDARGATQSKGEFRKIQNFIGPTKRLEDASYIPVPANEIDLFMENLDIYMNTHPYGEHMKVENKPNYIVFDEFSDPLIKSAIMHAQFESIHPFLDGNGRLGRIMIVLYLIQTKLIHQPVFFVSEELEKEKEKYYHMLNGVRGDHPDWASWILFFLEASERMSKKLGEKLALAEQLASDGLKICTVPSDEKVWLYTFNEPKSTVKLASKHLSLSEDTIRRSFYRLVDQGLLFTNPEVKRNKKFYNYDLLRILRD